MLLHLLPATAGTITFDGREITTMRADDVRPLRKEMQIIFQDPYASLNPRMTVGDIIREPLQIHGIATRQSRAGARPRIALDGRPAALPARIAIPHEFSGGQRQRVGIARALAVNPKFIVCDEPVSALDVSIQAQVINLLQDLQKQLGLTYLFIAHDLSVVRHISTRVAVMYVGKIVEIADRDGLYREPAPSVHAGAALGDSDSRPGSRTRASASYSPATFPSPVNPPSGCRFHTRCPDGVRAL